MKKNQLTVLTTVLSLGVSLSFLGLCQGPAIANTNGNSKIKLNTSLKNIKKNTNFRNNIPSTIHSSSISSSDINLDFQQGVQISQAVDSGQASWYGPGFDGRRTANGEVFNAEDLTAAHRSLPFGTQVRVTNVKNGRSVVVRINDRGPFSKGRVIDLSAGAARILRMVSTGVAPVKLEILGQ